MKVCGDQCRHLIDIYQMPLILATFEGVHIVMIMEVLEISSKFECWEISRTPNLNLPDGITGH